MKILVSEEYSPRAMAGGLLWMCPLLLPAMGWIVYRASRTPAQEQPVDGAFLMVCLAIPLFIGLVAGFRTLRDKGTIHWTLTEEEVIYESPDATMYGKSFRTPLGEIAEVGTNDDADLAWCRLRDGTRHRFYTATTGGLKFYRALKSRVEGA